MYEGLGEEGLSEARIRATGDDDLPMVVWEYLSDYEPPGSERRTVFLVELANFDIGNGGFVQYFLNTEGEYVDETVAALGRIGADHHGAIFVEAARRWSSERQRAGPRASFEAFEQFRQQSTLPELDGRWYQVRLEPIEARYIRAHAAAFVSEPVTPLPDDVRLELTARIHAGETEEQLTAWLRDRFDVADDAAGP